ncbi:MAG: MFS transporter [Planctomycetota bacterium]
MSTPPAKRLQANGMARWMIRRYVASFDGLSREVWLLALVLLVNRCGSMVVPFLAVYLREERGLDPLAIGWVLAACGVGGVVGSYLGGLLTERCGPVAVIIGSFALSAPAFAAIPFCDDTVSLFAVLTLRQIVADIARPASAAGATLFAGEAHHAQALALNRLANNLGFSIGPVIGGLLAQIDFFWIFPANAAASVAGAVFAYFALRSHLNAASARTDETTLADIGRGPWRDGPFLLFLALFALGELVFFQMVTTLPLFWSEQLGLSKLAIGGLYAVNTLLVVTCEMPLTSAVKRYRPLALVAVGAVFSAVGFGLTPLAGSLLGAALLVAVFTFGEMLSAPFSAAYAASRSGESRRGAFMGAYAMAVSAATVVSPVVALGLYRIDPALPWWCSIGALSVAAIGIGFLARRGGRAAVAAA